MKKLLAAIVSVILIFSVCVQPASAAGSGSLAMTGAAGKQGDTVSVAVNLNSNPGLVSMKFTVSYGANLELQSVANSGVLGGWTTPSPTISSPYTIRWADSLAAANSVATGKILTLTFKIKDTAAVGNETVTLTFSESRDVNGGKNTFYNTTATIKVNCKTHSYGAYSKVNDSQHSRTCSVCGTAESTSHTWNAGTVDKPASCKEAGNKKYTCTACNAEKNEAIAKTNNHSYGTWNETKKPACTATGTESRSCSVCNNTETRTINALGHSFTNPTVTKQPTCNEAGIESGKCTRCGQTTTGTIKAKGHSFGAWAKTTEATCAEKGAEGRKCSACGAAESREIEALGHDFENPTVVKGATIATTGLIEGKCKRCGEATSEVIPCGTTDEVTGIVFAAEEGVFSAGTEIAVAQKAQTDVEYEAVKTALAGISDKFVVFDIKAVLGDAAVQPNGKVSVTFGIPQGFSKSISVYFIAADGTKELVESTVSEDGKTVKAELSQFSVYAVCDTAAATNTDIIKDQESGSYLIWIIAGALILVAAGAAATVIIIRKRKSKNNA